MSVEDIIIIQILFHMNGYVSLIAEFSLYLVYNHSWKELFKKLLKEYFIQKPFLRRNWLVIIKKQF